MGTTTGHFGGRFGGRLLLKLGLARRLMDLRDVEQLCAAIDRLGRDLIDGFQRVAILCRIARPCRC